MLTLLFCLFVTHSHYSYVEATSFLYETTAFRASTPPRAWAKWRHRSENWRRRVRGRCGRSGLRGSGWGNTVSTASRSRPVSGRATRSAARAVRVLVGSRAPDASRMPCARASARTPSQWPHGRTRVPTRTRACERKLRRPRKQRNDGQRAADERRFCYRCQRECTCCIASTLFVLPFHVDGWLQHISRS